MDQNCRYKDWTLKNKNVAGILLYCMLAQIAFVMHVALHWMKGTAASGKSICARGKE